MPRRKRLDKTELLRRAVEIIRKNGFQETSVQSLAEEFHFSKPALYHYVNSKEDLLYEIYDRTITEWTQIAEDIRSDGTLSPDERIHQFLRRFLRFLVDHDDIIIFFTEKMNLSEQHFQAISGKERHLVDLIVGILDEGVGSGQIEPVPTKVLSFGIIGMAAWAYRWYSQDGPVSPEDLADLFHRILSRGYLASPR